MKIQTTLTVMVLFLIACTQGQEPPIELTFTASNDLAYVQLDSIKVLNRSQGGDTMLYWPDTVLLLDFMVVAPEINNDNGNFRVFQNFPNPVKDLTTISLSVPERDNVSLRITDMVGRLLFKSDRLLNEGIHSFRFSPGEGNLFLFTAEWRGIRNSIKVLHTGSYSGGRCSLEYMGSGTSFPHYKEKEIQDFIFDMGDRLLYVGYGNGIQSGLLDAPDDSTTYRFQFSTNIPCQGMPTLEYEGQVYNTIQVFSQCWMKENLNVGMMIPNATEMTDNGITEKYCYLNSEDSCNKYGGLYQWGEIMHYATQQGEQGICPPGWHLPTDEELKVLEGAVDSQYGIGDPEWEGLLYRGYDAGYNLKSGFGWNSGNGSDAFGFTGLPAGYRLDDGSFYTLGVSANWWTSTAFDPDETLKLYLEGYNLESGRYNSSKDFGFSVRCIRDDSNNPYKLLTGEVSKTWKLFREGVCMALGPNPWDPYGWWAGLTNNGARPCLYQQEFTFHYDGTYEFNDNGSFWAEYGVFNNVAGCYQNITPESCFEAIPANMINACGEDVSAWLSGVHAFTYDPAAGLITLNGEGAWIGIPKLATVGETMVPVSTVTFSMEITQETGYDLLTVIFDYGDGGYWHIVYVNYSDPSLEPELVLEEPPYGEDLPDLTPDEMWNTFETPESYVLLDTAAVYPGTGYAANNMDFFIGVADPSGGATNVGEYVRLGTYQELQFQMDYDIQFDNFTTVSLDVYMPSSNNYSGTLTKDIIIIIAEASQTEQWWTDHIQYDATALILDEWVTYTFNLDSPTSGAGNYTPYDRTDLDFFAISLGGGGHEDPGIFYIRNFVFE